MWVLLLLIEQLPEFGKKLLMAVYILFDTVLQIRVLQLVGHLIAMGGKILFMPKGIFQIEQFFFCHLIHLRH